MSENQPLVSVTWLIDQFENDKLVVLDATTEKSVLPDPVDPNRQYIANTLAIDLANKFSDKTVDLPNTLPPAEQITAQVQALGIDHDSKVVIYDARGAFSGPRAWWLLKSHGLTDVYLLNGGLNGWQAMGYPLVENKLDEADKPGDFKAQYQADCFVDKDEVHAWVLQNDLDQADNSYLIDVRSAERFAGLSPEPREGLRAGHIPHSLNLPFTQLLHPEDRSYLSHAALKDQFEAVLDISIDECIQKNTRLMFTCGSGMTACIALLAAWQLGLRNLAVYDGSWTEWGSDASLPIA